MANRSLAALPIGSSAVVTSLKLDGLLRRRLLDLGIVPGTSIKAVRRSPAGDPTAFAIRNTLIALREEEAGQIMISLINT